LALDKYEGQRDYSVTNSQVATLQRRTNLYDSTRNYVISYDLVAHSNLESILGHSLRPNTLET
jgi:hypothetical protein